MAANTSASADRALVQLVVLTSITAVAGALLFFNYQKRKQQQFGGSIDQQKQRATVDATRKDVTPSHDNAVKKPSHTPTPTPPPPQPSKPSKQQQPTPTPTPTPAPVNIGQEQATAATRKYKEGAFSDAVALYTDAIRLCEASVPVDARNLKVMFSNRAAAYERLQDFANVVADCSHALALDKRHPKSFLRRAKAKAALGELASALVDYVCLLVISEEKHEQIDESLALEISRIHTELATQELAAALAAKAADADASNKQMLPDQFFITSYYSSFHPSDDDTSDDVDAIETSAFYTTALDALDATDAHARGELLVKRALAYKTERDYEAAAADFAAAAAIVQPTNAALYYVAQLENGTFHHLRGDFAVAALSFENALRVQPASIYAKIRMGGLSFDQKDLADALAWFEKALADKPDSSTAFFHRGQLHSIDVGTDGANAEAALARAMADLERCIQLAPDFAMAFIQLGVTHARTGNFASAIERLEAAAALTPDVPEVYNYLGETYMQLLQVPGASVTIEQVSALFEKAMALDPTYPMAYINQGNVLVSRGSEYGHEALALFEQAVAQCPRSKIAACHLAQVYMAMQDYARALEQIDRAIVFALSSDELQELYALRITAVTHQQAQVLLM